MQSPEIKVFLIPTPTPVFLHPADKLWYSSISHVAWVKTSQKVGWAGSCLLFGWFQLGHAVQSLTDRCYCQVTLETVQRLSEPSIFVRVTVIQ